MTLVAFDNIENTSFATEYVVGESIVSRLLWEYTGVDPETGLYTFKDLDGDGRRTIEDRKTVVDLQDRFRGGVQNTLIYKGFSLSFLFRFEDKIGSNYLRDVTSRGPGSFQNHSTEFLNRWQNPGDNTTLARYSQAGTGATSFSNVKITNFVYSNASFVRLQNVSFSYSFSESLLHRANVNALTVFVQGQNLFTISDYLGWDPETTSSVSLPPLRTVTFGINLTF